MDFYGSAALTALSGCGEVDNGLLKKATSALATLETVESGGFRQDTYLDDMEAPAQTSETWFRSTGETVDWYMLATSYGDDGKLQMERAVAQRGGELYYRYSTPDQDGIWNKADGAAPSDEAGVPSINCLDRGEDYEFFRKETAGSLAFSYSQTGLSAFRAQLVALVKDGIPMGIDESQHTEEEIATLEKQYAYVSVKTASYPHTEAGGFDAYIHLGELFIGKVSPVAAKVAFFASLKILPPLPLLIARCICHRQRSQTSLFLNESRTLCKVSLCTLIVVVIVVAVHEAGALTIPTPCHKLHSMPTIHLLASKHHAVKISKQAECSLQIGSLQKWRPFQVGRPIDSPFG